MALCDDIQAESLEMEELYRTKKIHELLGKLKIFAPTEATVKELNYLQTLKQEDIF